MSFFLKKLNKCDFNEQNFKSTIHQSSFIKSLNKILSYIQNFFKESAKNSLYFKNIDNILIFIVCILFFGLLFLNTTQIGVIILLAFLVFLSKVFLDSDFKIKFSTIDFLILLILASAFLSTCFSSYFLLSLKGLLKATTYFCAYIVFRNLSYSNKRYFLIYILAFLGTTESFFAIVQHFIGVEALATWQDVHNTNPEQIMQRVYGTLQPYNPNLLAGFLIAALPSCLLVFFDNAINKKPLNTFLGLIATATVCLAVIFTGSRGAYLALAALILTAYLIIGQVIWHDFKDKITLKKAWIYIFIFGLLSLAFVIFNSPSLQHRIASIFAFRDDSSNSFRLNVYSSSLKMFLDNWLIGIGVGNHVFRNVYGLYMKTGFDALGAYSVPLEIAVETGIIGLFAFISFLTTTFVKSINQFKKENLNNKVILSSLLVGIFAMMVHGLFDTIWYRPQIQIIFWFYIALLANLVERKNV